jgi:O-antigen/teichoic acid export membrane protein
MLRSIKKLNILILALTSKISKNTVWLIILSIVIALSQFIVYALINKNLGKNLLGVWSLIVAATSIGQISNLGFSNSLVRYLPEMILKKKEEDIIKMIGTINFTNFFLTLPLLVLLYFPAIIYASYLLSPSQLLVFKSIIPLSMAALFINNLFSVYSYLLDAMQKYYLRCIVQITGWIFFLVFSIFLMPAYGLYGVAIALLFQYILQFATILSIIHFKGLLHKITPFHFDKKSFRIVSSFGVKSQYISILVIFFDPLVKLFITKNIGLSATANYEISNKIVIQVRNLLVSANQVIIPKIIIQKEAGTESQYFKEISNKNIFLSVSAGMLVLLFAPLAVYFFSNGRDDTLMQCIILLNIGWVCNMITSVHYYCSIGLDKIGKLVLYHLMLSLVVLILYFILNHFLYVTILYYIVPSVALFIGSIYNSYILLHKIENVFSWLRSGYFLYFIVVSSFLACFYFLNIITLNYLIMPVFFLLYICGFLKRHKISKPFNIQ